jgi:hypothetical protein
MVGHGNGDAQAVTAACSGSSRAEADRQGGLARHTRLIAGQRQFGEHHQLGTQAAACSMQAR